MHKIEVGISRAAEGKVGKFFVGNMSDERALELASKVASEGFVFGVRLFLEHSTHWSATLINFEKPAAKRIDRSCLMVMTRPC